jgi:hypothetical protein
MWHEPSEPRRYGELRGVLIHYWIRLLEDTQLERNVGLVVLWAGVFYALVFLMMKLRTKATKRASA